MSELSQIAPRENQALKKFTLFLFSFVLAFAFPIVFQIKTVALENQGFFWAHDYARALETFYFIALALLVCLVVWSYHSFLSYAKIVFKSSSAVVIGWRSKSSTKVDKTVSEKKAGKLGPT